MADQQTDLLREILEELKVLRALLAAVTQDGQAMAIEPAS